MFVVIIVHSLLRWLIVLAALAALVKYALGFFRRQPWDKLARGIQAGFSGLLDLQGLIGLIYLLWDGLSGGGFPLYRVEHLLVMIGAIVVGHLPARLKASTDRARYRNALLALIVVIMLVLIGVAALPGNRWAFQAR